MAVHCPMCCTRGRGRCVRVLAHVILLLLALPVGQLAAQPSGIYWSSIGGPPEAPTAYSRIWRCDLDGANPQIIVDGLANGAWPVVVDATTWKVYWGNVNSDSIQRANLDGSDVQDVVSGNFPFIGNPAGIALDSTNQLLYWTDFHAKKIARTNLVTNVTTTLIDEGFYTPQGIDLDLAGGRMYWVDAGISKDVPNSGRVRHANLDGDSGLALLVNRNIPYDVKIDHEGGKLYWLELFSSLFRSSLDGTNVEQIPLPFLAATRFEFDHVQRKLIWFKGFGDLCRSNLDGSGLELLVPEFISGGGIGVAVLHDCNENHIDDFDEIQSADCNANRNPDSCDPDADADGIPDDCDNCPALASSNQGDCDDDGLGDPCEALAAEQDDDGDAVCNGVDGCPNDPDKTAPGSCGCGVPDDDSDQDGVANCNDQCPFSPDVDSDGDSVLDCRDRCPGAPDVDSDGDQYLDCEDQCPGLPDEDSDADTIADCIDRCPGLDDRIDHNGDDIPDCLEFSPVPAVSTWGLTILALLLLAAAKIRWSRPRVLERMAGN